MLNKFFCTTIFILQMNVSTNQPTKKINIRKKNNNWNLTNISTHNWKITHYFEIIIYL